MRDELNKDIDDNFEDDFDDDLDDISWDDFYKKYDPYYAYYPKKDFIFKTPCGEFIFQNTAWHYQTDILFKHPREEISFTHQKMEDVFRLMVGPMHICSSIRNNSAKDFYFCLSACSFEFSCINKPVIQLYSSYDGISRERLEELTERTRKYRMGLMPPKITYEFPITIAYKGKDIPCRIRFRDTSWYEIDNFTVVLADGEDVPAGWQKNKFGEYAVPEDVLWKNQRLSNALPTHKTKCSPYRFYMGMGVDFIPLGDVYRTTWKSPLSFSQFDFDEIINS